MAIEDMFGNPPLDVEVKKESKTYVNEFSNMDPQQQSEHLHKIFQEVFGTKHGKLVLGIILEDLYYFSECKNDEARALNNYAKALISQRLGFNNNQSRVEKLFD